MQFLALVRRLQVECGVSGAAPTTLVNQPAEIQRLTNWINAAWTDIQELHTDWDFMRSPFQFDTIANTETYTPEDIGIPTGVDGTILGNWKQDSFRIYYKALGVTNESFLSFCRYDMFRDIYEFGGSRLNRSRPVDFTVDPQKNIRLGQVPDDIYTVNGEFFKKPSELVADTDAPSMPSEFHLTIVYRAMMHYGAYEAATEVWQRGSSEFTRMKTKLEIDQLPAMEMGEPLA